MNLCAACGEDFGSLEAFDAHRVGVFLQCGPSEYAGSIKNWTPSMGRRCLTVEEMRSGSFQGRQFAHNIRGRWSLEKRLNRSRKSFASELPSSEGQTRRSEARRRSAPRAVRHTPPGIGLVGARR
jgi:hypothetical protein